MRGKALLVAVVVSALALAACGGSSDGTTDAQTRAVSGSLTPPAAIIVKAMKAADGPGSCTEIEPDICRVIATATDGTTVVDGNLADCAFSLALTVGKDYVLSLVGPDAATGACDQFVATLLSSRGSLFDIAAGDAVDLGLITINPDGTATFSGSYAGFLSCTDLGFEDADADGACDNWDGDLPDDAGDFDATMCDTDAECGDGEYCATDIGYCFSDGYGACDSDDECEALFPGEGKICDPELYVCVETETESDWQPGDAAGIDDLAGTYLISKVNTGACANDDETAPYQEIVTVAGGVVSIEGWREAGHNLDCYHPATALSLDGTLRSTPVELDCYPGCPIDVTTNLFHFVAGTSSIQLEREITVKDGPTFDVGCILTYVKQ